MRIRLVDAIQMSIGERVAVRLPMTKMDFTAEPYEPTLAMSDQVKHIARVEVWFSQIAPIKAGEKMRQTAIRAIAHHIYKDVEVEIREALHELWQDGLHDTAAAKRLEAMLPALRGEQDQT
jgi:hypothetical protein